MKSNLFNWLTGFLCIMFFGFFAMEVEAQIVFGPQRIIAQSETNGAHSVYAADLDGDGDMDILTASYIDDKIAWYANDGTGNFGEQQIISTDADFAESVYAADLDGDGDMDVLSASVNDNKIAWYENDGTGNFNGQQIISLNANGAFCVYATDIDGDGDMDVLSASHVDNKIAWYENNGTGNFGEQQIISTTVDGARSVYAADLDGDGDIDVLSAAWNDGKVAWYANDGTGNFGEQQIISTTAYGANTLYAIDIDDDGDMDVLSASFNMYTDKIVLYKNDGAGNFGEQQIISSTIDGARSVYAADVDDDGDIDILTASHSDDIIAWYENDGTGSFGAQHIISTVANGAYSVYAADMDGDGDIDVLSASTEDSKIAWYENDGSGNFGLQLIISTVEDGADSAYIVDIDGDGDLDVLTATDSAVYGKIAWYENDGTGNFGERHIISTVVSGPRSVYAADLDGDGDMDVLSASSFDNKIAWYENDGIGNFGAQQIISITGNDANFVFAADLNGDGHIDVLSTSIWDDKIAWYENDGVGNFGSEQFITTAVNITFSIYAADLDNDGDMDVLSASRDDDKIAWYENDGTGNFGVQQIISTIADNAYSVYAADLDNDGDMDVLSASMADDKIAWYENDGAGSFGEQQIISTAADGARSVYAADMDNDGDIDVLSASRNDNKIAWYENDGAGNFGAQQIINTVAYDARYVYAADINGDGHPDVLSVSLRDNKIAWYENLPNIASLSGNVFYDVNQNGILESGEFGLGFQNINVEPDSYYNYADNEGFFICYHETAGNYTLNYTVPNNWSATTPTSYTIALAEGENSPNHNFGLYPNTLVTNVQPFLTSGINRCDWQVPYYLSIINDGNTIVPLSVVSLQLDPLLTNININPMPDSIGIQGWIYWHVNNLPPYQQTQFTVLVQEPDFSAMGDTLFNNATVSTYNIYGEQTDFNTYSYNPIVTCAYDPNDKQVTPSGIGEQNYTLIGQELFYTIRFQNTGNDTAFNIIIADTLSAWLDHSSFRIINSSHTMQTNRYPSGLVEFRFNNIQLPDSTVNEPGSHGYILYAVRPIADLPDYTVIANTAHIFFDQNPAIVTNTTQNTMVFELPIIQDLPHVGETLSSLTLIPNPAKNLLTIQYTSQQSQPTTLHLYDLTGRELHKESLLATLGTNNYVLDMTKYPNGMYVVTLNNGVEVVSGKVVKE